MMYLRKQISVVDDGGRWRVAMCVVCLALIAIALLTKDVVAQDVGSAQQFDLRGTVVDAETGQALVGAFVSLAGSEWGSLTSEEGLFRIPDLQNGRVSLSVELIGYETLAWEGSVSASVMPVLSLTPQAIVLEGLQVVTNRFQSRRNATAVSVRAFDRTALSTTPQRTVLDFVGVRAGLTRATCPAAAVSSVCFWVRGRPSESTVYVDEMPVLGGLDYLSALPPHELYMVEVYGQGRHIRAYTNQFMERAAKDRLRPVALLF